LEPIIEKAKAEVAARQPAPAPKPVAAANPARSVVRPDPVSSTNGKKNIYADSDEFAEDAPAAAAAPSKSASKSAAPGKPEKDTKNVKAAPAAPAATTKKKGAEDEDFGPTLQVSNKAKRMEDEKALKTLKWSFEAPRKEFIDQLRTQMEVANFSRTLLANMFQEDFKFHIKALDLLQKALDDCQDAIVSNVDLILRWLTLRFFETNPTVILKAIDYMSALFTMLNTVKNYHLVDYEANAFIPYFIGKLGDRQDSIRKGFRQIIKQIQQIYSPVKVFGFLITGLASKNSRQRTECLEELGQMIETLGLDPFNPATNLKEIAKQIGDRDNGVRNAALNTVTIAFQIVGEKVYKFIGKINEKELSMLDERIKRSAKMPLPPAALKLQQPAAPAQPPQQAPGNGMHPSSSANSINQQQPSILNNINNVMNNNNNNSEANAAAGGVNSRTMNRTPKKYAPSPTQPVASSNINTSPLNQGGANFTSFAAVANNSASKPRREFTLDIKDDDEDLSGMPNVKLTNYSDIEEIMRKPVELPPKRNVRAYQPNILKETTDVKEAIDLVITHISHHDIATSIRSLLQVRNCCFFVVLIEDRMHFIF
jgi:hypothetical protein